MGLPDIDDPTTDFELPYEDYSFQADPETDVPARVIEKVGVELSAISQTIGRAGVHVDAGVGPVVLSHRAVWGNTSGVAPTVVRNGTGDHTITWAASYEDLNPTAAKRETHSVNFQFAHAVLCGGVAGFIDVAWTANTITVLTWNSAGVAADIDFCAWGF